jgi:hypothetical protein
MPGSTTIIDWLGYGSAAGIPNASTLNALLASGSIAFYFAHDTDTLYVLDRNTPIWRIVSVGGGGVSAFSELSDVSLTLSGSPASVPANSLIKYNGSDWVNITPTQATALLDVMVGDSGSGGAKGLVPAPAAGDATKFLTGAGTYATATAAISTVTKTANYTILTGDSGKHFNNIGASADIALTLPAAAANLNYGFALDAAHYLRVNANGTDVISLGGSNSAGGGYVRSNSDSAYLLLIAHGTGKWKAISTMGPWSIDS